MHTHIIICLLNQYYSTSSTRWTGIRYVSLQCENELDCRLQFGMEAPTFTPFIIISSRGISTVPLTLSIPMISTTTATGAIATEISTTAEVVDTQSQTVAMATNEMSTSAEVLEDNILEYVRETPTFNRIRALVSVVGGMYLYIYSSVDSIIKII